MPIVRDKYARHELKEITFYVIFGLVMTIIIPIFIGFGLGGFSETFVAGRALEFGDFLVTYIIYYIMIFAGLIGLPILKIREMLVTKRGEHPATQSKPDILSVSYLHDPETDGLLYNLFHSFNQEKLMRWSLSIPRMFMIGIIFFGIIGLLQAITNFAFVGIPQMPFQVTPFGEAFFAAEPPSFAETTMMLFVFSLLMGLNAWISSKFKFGKLGYFTIGVIVCLLIGGLWMGFHNIVYGSSEAALLSTFIFGAVGSLLTLLFGSFIFWWCWHFANNLFYKLSSMFTAVSEDLVFISIIVLALLFIGWISTEFLIRRLRKGKPEKVVVPE